MLNSKPSNLQKELLLSKAPISNWNRTPLAKKAENKLAKANPNNAKAKLAKTNTNNAKTGNKGRNNEAGANGEDKYTARIANTGHQNKTLPLRKPTTGTLPVTNNLPGQMQNRKIVEPL